MIVVDVNVVAYLLIAGPFTEAARQTLRRDPEWRAPGLWRHEFLNVLSTAVRAGQWDEGAALQILANAHQFVDDSGPETPRADVLRLAVASSTAIYDCEYVVMARQFGVKVVTNDKPMLAKFADVTVPLEGFAKGAS